MAITMSEREPLPPAPRDDWGRFHAERGSFGSLLWVRPSHLVEIHPNKPAHASAYPSREVQRAAMAKWDEVLDPTKTRKLASAYEEEHHIRHDDTTGEWEGHCDQAAAASIYFESTRATANIHVTDEVLRFLVLRKRYR